MAAAFSNPLIAGNPLGDGNLGPDGIQNSHQMGIIACEPLSLAELPAAAARGKTIERPQALTEEEKDRLVATVKQEFETQRMSLVDLQCGAGLVHVCSQTVLTALNERSLNCYRELYKFIRKNSALGQVGQARKDWLPDKECANIAFTDENVY